MGRKILAEVHRAIMSGHSKWSTIKRQKGVTDARRSQLFTKLGREISVATRNGGSDPETNSRLRLAIANARDNNMPKDTIERAIKRATGEGGGAELVEVTYEGYGPGGTAILIEALTDNRNRTVSDIRNVFAKAGGNLGEAGSVAWQFEPRGLIALDATNADPEELALRAMDTGAEDVNVEGGSVEVFTKPEEMEAVRRELTEAEARVVSAEVANVPKSTVPLDTRQAEQVLRLLEKLDELDDVQRVSSNADFPDEVLAAYA
jgi:YebC/PmpR family DNA-binding regulatory protein